MPSSLRPRPRAPFRVTFNFDDNHCVSAGAGPDRCTQCLHGAEIWSGVWLKFDELLEQIGLMSWALFNSAGVPIVDVNELLSVDELFTATGANFWNTMVLVWDGQKVLATFETPSGTHHVDAHPLSENQRALARELEETGTTLVPNAVAFTHTLPDLRHTLDMWDQLEASGVFVDLNDVLVAFTGRADALDRAQVWSTFVALSRGWTGTQGDLLDTAVDLTGTPALV